MSIQKELDAIKNAVYGKEVRGAIHDGIKKTYDDASVNGNANMEVALARGVHPTLGGRLEILDKDVFSLNQQLAETFNKNDTGVLNLNIFDEETRLILQNQEPGNINAVVGANNIKNFNLTDKSVDVKNIRFLSDSVNLLDRTRETAGYRISPTGELTNEENNADYNTTDYIPTNPGEIFSTRAFYHVAWYDEEKRFLNRTNTTDYADARFTAPEKAYYLRGIYNPKLTYSNQAQINRGNTLLPFEPYGVRWEKSVNPIQKDSVGTIELQDKSVTIDKVGFIKQSTNIINTIDYEKGKIVGSDGVVNDNKDYNVSPEIPTYPHEKLQFNYVSYIAYYDKNDAFIRRITADISGSVEKETPVNAYIIRAVVSAISQYRDVVQINRGNVLLPFEPFYKPFLKGVATDGVGNTPTQPPQNILESEPISFITSDNLFNEKVIHEFTTVNANTGELVHSTNNHTSHLIRIKPLTPYSMTGITLAASYYDKDKKFISRDMVTGQPAEDTKITSPSGAHYMRVTHNSGNTWWDGLRQVNEGSVLKPYDHYHASFTEESGLAKLNRIISKDMMDRNDSYMIDVPVNGVFKTSETFPDYTNFKAIKHGAVYDMFDALMVANPEYITSEIIGQDVSGNDIKMYKMKPVMPSTDKNIKTPKIFLTCGLHGGEKSTTVATYNMFKQMCENWKNYPLLEALRFNVEWLYIPVANPSGWDLHSRNNAVGVDLNRNFPHQWKFAGEGTNTYSGPSPMSEPESKAIDSVFKINPDIDIFCDFHNFGPEILSEGQNQFLWILTDAEAYVQHMASNLITRLSRTWEDDFDWYPSGSLAGYTSKRNGGPGLLQNYANSLGIKFAGTLEICNTWKINPTGVGNGEDVTKAGFEAITNWMLINLRELIK